MHNLFVTEQQKYLAYRAVIFRIATTLRVKNKERKTNHELYCEIKDSESPLLDPMYSYFRAYDNWFEFRKNKMNSHRISIPAGELAGSSNDELKRLAQLRERAYNRFMKQCELLQAN
ncbi:MAG TPA: hypothetical protein VL651_06070 [Bacteroidia bacterium]|jgi:hypothetical protein|nr:hypothetical protein [Bacteroidia bacterium]